MQRVVLTLIGLVLLTGCSSKLFTVPSTSMEPTIKPGSLVFVDTACYKQNPVQRFDMVVVRDPDESANKYVKRVVGLGGEIIQIQSGKVFVDGKELKESFSFIPSKKDFGPLTIPPGQFFLLGDNRPVSFDSTSWRQATVGKDAILGKVGKIVEK